MEKVERLEMRGGKGNGGQIYQGKKETPSLMAWGNDMLVLNHLSMAFLERWC